MVEEYFFADILTLIIAKVSRSLSVEGPLKRWFMGKDQKPWRTGIYDSGLM